ncbi:DUF202 domain-containing protein [Nesterenkonia muleiensis]|uniref:DUF202 domain-containing protein n=1 Tax=Nesterenkonia muleiensis TaxID=2282648 RepID=UPI000E75EEB3|nr:DUF202 domain-containing protein [Nesterenkonia muleiensis]
MRTRPAAHQDPGVQPERTLLSWTRTALLLVVVAGMTLRWAPYHGPAVLTLFCAALIVAAGISLRHRRRLVSSTWGIADGRYPPAVGSVAGLALAVAALGMVALVLLLVT